MSEEEKKNVVHELFSESEEDKLLELLSKGKSNIADAILLYLFMDKQIEKAIQSVKEYYEKEKSDAEMKEYRKMMLERMLRLTDKTEQLFDVIPKLLMFMFSRPPSTSEKGEKSVEIEVK